MLKIGKKEYLLSNLSKPATTVDVLVVDDSPLMLRIIQKSIESDPRIRVIGTASNGAEAIEKVVNLRPDVVTLDVEMLGLNGLETLQIIMAHHPTPVIMLSGLKEAEIVMQSLQFGAVDFVAKPSGIVSIDLYKIQQELIAKIKLATLVNLKTLIPTPLSSQSPIPLETIALNTTKCKKYVAIGSSTGGPTAVTEILRTLPANLPVAIFIVQHIPEGFTTSFAKRLNKVSSLRVQEARNNEVIKPGTVYLAPSGLHMVIRQTTHNDIIQLKNTPPINSVRPSIDVLMTSLAEVKGADALGILLTGMGRDGVEGLAKIKNEGGYTIAQDKQTSIVFGMPKAAIQRRVVDAILPLYEIPHALVKALMETSDG